MARSSRSRKAKLGNKENVPPPGVDSQSQSQTKSKKRSSSVLDNLSRAPKTKKAKGPGTRKELPPPPTFQGLPYDVLDHLLKFLDVRSLMALGRTCSQFDLIINGRYLTSIRLPFSKNGTFMKEIRAAEVIEKKPVLRILCRKFDVLDYYQNYLRSSNKVFAGKYQLDAHMAFLCLKKVREVDLFPDEIPDGPLTQSMVHQWSQTQEFDKIIIGRLAEVGALRNISRMNIMFTDKNHGEYIGKIMKDMPNLLELNLFVAVNWGIYDYACLRKIIAATRAPRVNLIIKVFAGATKAGIKVLRSDYIEKLHVKAHCSLNFHLIMKSLKEVTLELTEGGEMSCTYPRSRMEDRKIHRAGRCIVELASVHGNCPSLVNFNGIHIGHISQALEFGKWSSRIKTIFHKDYLKKGGTKEMKKWASTRWFKKKPVIPALQ